jgi:FdhD protein
MTKTTPWDVLRVGDEEPTVSPDALVTEEPVEISLDGTPIAVLMRTPGDDEELVAGFAITEGIVLGPTEIERVAPIGDNEGRYELVLAGGVSVDPEQFRRNLFASSSCGVCGKASIDALRVAAPPLPQGPELTADVVLSLPGAMLEAQETFSVTGGLHAAAAFTASGELVVLREDVGRHNAVDKVVGALTGVVWPPHDLILVVSGRISFEIVQKAAVAGIPVVCGVSAASSLAVELGEELGLTVIGFLRGRGFNVYSGTDRLEA